MGITYGDHLIDSGHYDITPEEERAREEAAFMAMLEAHANECPLCGGDCSAANPPVYDCPMHAPAGQVAKEG